MKKNDIIELQITDVTNEGNGVGRHDAMAVFVPFTAPGDIIDCRIAKMQSSYAFGIIEGIKSASPQRVENDCAAFPMCGGCSLRHMSYESECAVKQKWVADNMRRIGKTGAEILPIIPSPSSVRYRNKAIYPISIKDGRPVAGFYGKRSHRVIPHEDCLLQPELFSSILSAVLSFIERNNISVYDEESHKGLVRSLFLRIGEETGEVMLCLVINGSVMPKSADFTDEMIKLFPQIKTVLLNENTRITNVVLGYKNRILFGGGTISDKLCGLNYTLSPQSFYQVNHSATELLYGEVGKLCDLKGDETVIDLYCGVGTIGLSLSAMAKRVIGVEIVPEAVKNARDNASANGITNAEFIEGDAAVAAKMLAEQDIKPDVVIVDPPRKGLEPELIDTIVKMGARRVVMVSCNSATAARDIQLFEKLGYEAVSVRPVDMFPRSAHVESVILLRGAKADI